MSKRYHQYGVHAETIDMAYKLSKGTRLGLK